MRIAVLSHTAEGLEALRRAVQADGHEVALGAVREPGKPLAPQLRPVEADLLVLEGACGSREDLAAVERLTAEHPGLRVLMMCAGRDPEALIAAMRCGVHEVLHAPLDRPELSAALHRAARRRPAPAQGAPASGRVVAFIACKGGSGATVLATNFAHVLATERGKRVGFIDLDLEYGDALAFLTDQRPKATVADVAQQVDRLDAKLLATSMLAVAPNLFLLPAPEDPADGLAVTGVQIERLLDVARASFEVVVLDLGRMFDGTAVKALDKSDLVFPVMEDLVPSVRDARRLMRTFDALGYSEHKVHLLVNRYDKRAAIPVADLEKAVGAKVFQTVPNSFAEVAQAINLGVPLSTIAPRNPVLAALRDLISQVIEAPAERRGWLGRLVEHAR